VRRATEKPIDLTLPIKVRNYYRREIHVRTYLVPLLMA
jgi:hypothetical protein